MSEEFSDDFSEDMSEEISEGFPEDFADDFEVEDYEEDEGGRSFLIWAGALLLLFIAISACMLVYMITRGDGETTLADVPAQETATAITVLNMTTEANNALVTLTVEAIEAGETAQAEQQEEEAEEAEEAEEEMIAATATAEVVESTREVEATATAEAVSDESGTGGDPGQGGVGDSGEGAAGGESPDTEATDPPDLSGPWVEPGADGSDSTYQTADDILSNDFVAGAAELLNNLPNAPQIEDPAPYIEALTPEVLAYLANNEDGFVAAVDPSIFEMMSQESLAYLLEEYPDEIDPEVAELLADIAGSEDATGEESTEEPATDAPELSGPWVEPGPDGSDSTYQTADDLLDNDTVSGAAELLNALPNAPQIDDPAPYIEALTPEVIEYVADNEDGFVAALEPSIFEMMSSETLTYLLEEHPDEIDPEVADHLTDIAAGEDAAGGEGSDGAAGGTGTDGTLPSTGTSALTIAVVGLALVAVLVVARRLRTL